jgi:hypothetical protein
MGLLGDMFKGARMKGQLRDAGVLTPEEFEQQKRRILEG